MAKRGNPWDIWHQRIKADKTKTRQQQDELCDLATAMRLNKFIPYWPSPYQIAIILATEREVLAGGEAGSGKTDGVMFKALCNVTVEDYLATFFRENLTQLIQPGGPIWQMRRFLKSFLASGEVVWNVEARSLYWPEYNSTIDFTFMGAPGDENNQIGVPRQGYFWEELTRFPFRFDQTEGDVWNPYQFLVRSQRKPPGMPVQVQTYATTNPGGTSEKFVRDYFLPPPPKGIRQDIPDSKCYMIWQPRPESGGRLYLHGIRRENPGIDHAEYDKSEALADETTKRQQFGGEWGVVETGGVFHTWEVHRVPFQPPVTLGKRRTWDKAGTVGGSGPRSATLLICAVDPEMARRWWGDLCHKVKFVICGGLAGRWSADQREENIDIIAAGSIEAAEWYKVPAPLLLTLDDGRKVFCQGDGRDIEILHEQEPGSGGKQSAEITTRRLAGYGFIVSHEKVTGDKQTRARQMAAAMNAGMYAIVDDGSFDVEQVLADFKRFPNGLIDFVDAGSLGHNDLALGVPQSGPPRLGKPREKALGYRAY